MLNEDQELRKELLKEVLVWLSNPVHAKDNSVGSAIVITNMLVEFVKTGAATLPETPTA